MRRINAPFNSCRLIRFDIVMRIGLARGFMYAGAPRIVASLWKLDDRATSELMKRFYQGMLGPEALRPAGALRQAQLTIWKEKQWRAPYYWAAFVLQGEWK